MQKIQAIKLVRERTTLGLKESKELVEALAPFLQISRMDIENAIDATEYSIRSCQSYGDHISIEQAKRLVMYVEERDILLQLLRNIS